MVESTAMNPHLILRHKRENRAKCTLTPLEGRPDFTFLTYPLQSLPDLSNYTVLTMDAPLLTAQDAVRPLCLIDATWHLASKMLQSLGPLAHPRSLPPIHTAYPRKQTGCPDPQTGLASIEALYHAFAVLGLSTEGLLDHYYWKGPFLYNYANGAISSPNHPRHGGNSHCCADDRGHRHSGLSHQQAGH